MLNDMQNMTGKRSKMRNRLRGKLAIWMVTIGLLLSGCAGGQAPEAIWMEPYKGITSTDLSSEKGELSAWGMTKEQVKTEQGKPDFEGSTDVGGTVLEYKGYQYLFRGGKLEGIAFKEGGNTARQVGVGDGEGAIAESYGPNFLEREQQGFQIIGYIDQENKRILEFSLKDGKVEFATVFQVKEY
ncbi:hypothetical protein ACFQZE_20495 [Paenibacillus sp. GCM10027627]|uniref:hypothetical protein n=1 Tax=unclassified Paenibacillus TaxID=185978 RepID=UPI003641A1CF